MKNKLLLKWENLLNKYLQENNNVVDNCTTT